MSTSVCRNIKNIKTVDSSWFFTLKKKKNLKNQKKLSSYNSFDRFKCKPTTKILNVLGDFERKLFNKNELSY